MTTFAFVGMEYCIIAAVIVMFWLMNAILILPSHHTSIKTKAIFVVTSIIGAIIFVIVSYIYVYST